MRSALATRWRIVTGLAGFGRVDEVLKRGARFFPLDVDPGIDRVAWVKWEGEAKLVVEPAADLIRWA